jgi:hypothetical protein
MVWWPPMIKAGWQSPPPLSLASLSCLGTIGLAVLRRSCVCTAVAYWTLSPFLLLTLSGGVGGEERSRVVGGVSHSPGG